MTLVAVRANAPSALGLDGTGYEIGLTAGHARALGDTGVRYAAAARRQACGGTRPAGLGARRR
jgi:hypothetical protein